MKESQIKIDVSLDENNVPEVMEWSSSDGDNKGNCDAVLISVWDKKEANTLKIDLWTTEMQVSEMDRFFYQTLRALGDTYFKATQNREMAVDIQRFTQYFGEKTEVIPKQN